jgi:hypothetical protein
MPSSQLLEYAVTYFKRGAVVYAWGYEMDDKKMQSAGLACAKLWIVVIDDRDEGRTSLIPLLEDPDLNIRVFAAGFLTKVMPERVVPILTELVERGPAFINVTAHWFVERYKHGTDL